MGLRLIFRLDSDAPLDRVNKWQTICDALAPGTKQRVLRSSIVTDISTALKSEGVGRPIDQGILRRYELGFGGGDNCKNRQLRFWKDGLTLKSEVAMLAIDSDDGIDRWTVLELVKFKQVIQKALEEREMQQCLQSMIVIPRVGARF